jgi:hypothetical protein
MELSRLGVLWIGTRRAFCEGDCGKADAASCKKTLRA